MGRVKIESAMGFDVAMPCIALPNGMIHFTMRSAVIKNLYQKCSFSCKSCAFPTATFILLVSVTKGGKTADSLIFVSLLFRECLFSERNQKDVKYNCFYMKTERQT